MPSSIGHAAAAAAAAFFFADLVTGPKYPSCDASRLSEGVGVGVGDGEMTLGVPGIARKDDRDMVNGGRQGVRMAPET